MMKPTRWVHTLPVSLCRRKSERSDLRKPPGGRYLRYRCGVLGWKEPAEGRKGGVRTGAARLHSQCGVGSGLATQDAQVRCGLHSPAQDVRVVAVMDGGLLKGQQLARCSDGGTAVAGRASRRCSQRGLVCRGAALAA
jgi:hypothetical protein